jgi:3-oxoacyl-(acyl-carrier-protein) synthase
VPGFALARVDVRPHLKRRRDRKLLPRAAELAIAAASEALGADRPPDVGLFLGVGREPSDGGDSERAILAAVEGGRFSASRFGRSGLPHYPPLSSLRTLPNLVLAHVAIQLDLTGEGGTRAGTADAGIAAVVDGWRAVAEGRCEVALAGAADSQVDAASARDLVRGGLAGVAPGEAAAVLRLEALERCRERGAPALALVHGGGTSAAGGAPWTSPHQATLGECGAAAGAVALALALGAGGRLEVTGRQGTSAWVAWRLPC